MDGGLPNYRPTRLNDSGNFSRPLTKNRRFFHIFIFYLNSPNHALHSRILLGVFLVGKSYWISIFKTNKSTGPDNIPAWVLKEHADCLAAPLASIFNCSLREGVLPTVWKSANIIPLPKTKPLMSVKTDIRPIPITPIAAKVFESILMKYVDDIVCDAMDSKRFGGIAGTSTTDALVSMTHRWYEATDILNTYVRVVMLDFSKAFDLINHHILLEKLTNSGLPRHMVRWIGAFLLGRRQKVMIGSNCSRSGSPNGGVPQGTLSGPKCFFIVH